MKFFLSKEELKPLRIPPVVNRIKNWLDQQKRGELFKAVQLSVGVGCSLTAVEKSNHFIPEYCCIHKRNKYFGSKATITRFRKEINKHVND